jgi:hypothetical protein
MILEVFLEKVTFEAVSNENHQVQKRGCMEAETSISTWGSSEHILLTISPAHLREWL